ncbi:thioesterase [Leptospira perolatii]|uniref:Thioesterase n=1 Tax=Leptospira perolatii TaxID=2023191 RepID=A0A2M9ZSR9_9LEPT|nr:acyl-CoA thioesterase [Leptospira perolatii]PJZ68777.1 thioesterase [Leptospira perolatii]PJZ75132.1 thioesterase [Leptospira perolatii]
MPKVGQENFRTRFSDLDTQRHVTSRTYEEACLGDRYRILEEAGFNWKQMLSDSISLKTQASDIRFLAQQMENSDLEVRTNVRSGEGGFLLFQQDLLDSTGKVAAEIRTLARTEKAGILFEAIPATESAEALISSFEPILPFSGSCERTGAERDLFFCERNPFGDYNPSHYWRILEEGRWNFTAESGLSLDHLIAMDTTYFYMGGKIRYAKPLIAGRKVVVKTWIRNFEKIWCRMRQEITDSITQEVLAESLDDLLVVSISKTRPKRVTEEMLKDAIKNTEYPEGWQLEGDE